MPAETIHGMKTVPVDIRIAWGADCEYVEVAAIREDSTTEILKQVLEYLVSIEVIDGNDVEAVLDRPKNFYFDGWHALLSERSSLNRMIHVLKRARDNAFGKDE